MNWEVWTMPRKTSCCNGTLLRSDVRHYWPAGFLYVLVWLMILPIPLLQTARDYLRFQSEQTVQLAAQLHNHVYAAMTGSLVLAVLAGAVIPMAVYAYLMTPRAVGLMHTLPVTRTSQFFTHFLSGFGLLTAGNLLIFLLSALAMMPSGSVDWAALGLWLLVTELLELFFLSGYSVRHGHRLAAGHTGAVRRGQLHCFVGMRRGAVPSALVLLRL